jgi:hypothetical protein
MVAAEGADEARYSAVHIETGLAIFEAVEESPIPLSLNLAVADGVKMVKIGLGFRVWVSFDTVLGLF